MLFKVALESVEDDSRIPDSGVDVVVIGSGKKVKFSRRNKGGFVRGEIRDQVFTMYKSLPIELPGSG